MDQDIITLKDYTAIIRRRKWSLILPAVVVMALAVAVAFLLPPVFKSTATILIEEQEIPADFVMSAVTSYAEQRIQTINQRIMSSTRLLEIINRFDLYHGQRDILPAEELVERMRKDTNLEMINANVIDPRSSKPLEVAIAFTLSYEGKDDARKVQQVTTVLTSLFLEENLRLRTHKTKETAQFMEDEMKKVKKSLDLMEAKVANFKERNINSLPELLQVNIQNLNNIERSLELMHGQLHSQKERESFLQTQLAGLAPRQDENTARLDQLRVELVELKTRFSDKYPDVIKARTEIADLERQVSAPENNLEQSPTMPDNPAHVILASQLASTQAEIESSKLQIKILEDKAVLTRLRIDNTPRVEETYRNLMAQRDNTQAKFNDLMRKVMEARVSEGLEKEQKGGRFTLIDPAWLPEKPYKPNRPAILLVGMVLSVVAGVGFAAMHELLDTSMHSAAKLTAATSVAVLAVIPSIHTARDLARRRRREIALAVAVVVALGAVLFRFQVMALSLFWVN